jgi:hypothetical protein
MTPFHETPQLEATWLRDAAARRGGHDDFGSGWEEGLDVLVNAIRKLDMPPVAQAGAAKHLGMFLDARLTARKGLKENPGYRDVAIRQPIIIAGLVRSGTTALHKLLSMDPNFQVPEHWLTMAPMPRPPRSQWADIPSYRVLSGHMDSQLQISPELKEHHIMAVDEAEETLFIQAQTFCSNMFPSMYDAPDYDRWFRATDERPHYRHVADVLRLIGLHEPERRWLLKNPTDLYSLGAVLDVFPDALVIQTHRDPVQSIPSVASTILSGRRMVQCMEPNADRIGDREAEFWAEALRRAAQARSRTGTRAIDIEFSAFMTDQLGTIKRIYSHFGLPLAPETEARMQRWLAANPRRSAALQRVAPEEFGLTAAGLKSIYADYRLQHGYT